MDTIFIYTISDPLTDLVRYVGKTKDPSTRFRKHRTERNKTLKCQWIKSVIKSGMQPIFTIIDECSEIDWEQKERFYILLFKSLGAKLTNLMPGGEGGPTMRGRKLTAEQSQKITNAKIGKANPATGIYNQINKGYKINRYDLYGNLVEVHPSIRHAALCIGRDDRRIQMMVAGNERISHVGGFKFERSIETND